MSFRGLNRVYFSQIAIRNGYEIIKCKDTPHLILFSKINGAPLASICLLTQDTKDQDYERGTKGKTLISHLPSDKNGRQRVQGLIDKDNQKFELVISNLLPDDSHYKKDFINFNILKTDDAVSETNPGGLNQINELRPNESYAIKSDYTKENRCLILSSLKKEDDGIELTIKDDEENAKKTDQPRKGIYLYLSVVPQLDSKYAGLFEDTIWKSCEFFVRKEVYTSNYFHKSWDTAYFYDMRDTNSTLEDIKEDIDIDESYDCMETFSFPKERCLMKKTNNLKDFNGPTSINTINHTLRTPSYKLRSTPMMPNNVISPFKPNSDEEIYNSKASKIKYGEVIKVNSCETNIVYDFDKVSHPIVMGLSVIENIKFNLELNDNEVLELSKPIIDELVSFIEVIDELELQEKRIKFLNFLETKVYDQDMCILSMDEDDKPDIVFYTCGHKCIKYENLSNDLKLCPLCKTTISAYLRVNRNNEGNLN